MLSVSRILVFGSYKPHLLFFYVSLPSNGPSKYSSSIGRRSDKTGMLKRGGAQKKAVLPRFLARLAEGVEVPQLANGHAEHSEEVSVEDLPIVHLSV